MILPGTYANGFAPRDGQAIWPELWRGCVGAWNPGLGPTGLRLYDWSPYRNHGTLTNMAADGDWVTSQGIHVLDFDSSNDFVLAGSNQLLFASQPFSIVWRERVASTTTYPARFRLRSATNTFAVLRSTDPGYASLAFAEWRGVNGLKADAPSVASSVGIWRHFALVGLAGPQSVTSSQYLVFCDGIQATVTQSLAFSSFSGTNNQIGWDSLNFGANCQMSDIGIYNRALHPNEIRLLATRPGIAYELAPRRWSAAMIEAYRRRTQYAQLVGGGII
jgi:hypothetical protein